MARVAKTGRNRAWTPDRVRERIQASNVAERLCQHVRGEIELTATQVSAATTLLRKIVPDLSAVELHADVQHTTISSEPISIEQWAANYVEQSPNIEAETPTLAEPRVLVSS